MIRLILIQTTLFLLPFLIYGLFLAARRNPVFADTHWTPKLVLLLTGASILLILGGFLYFGHTDRVAPGSTYVPPRFEDGRLIPGHFVPRPGNE